MSEMVAVLGLTMVSDVPQVVWAERKARCTMALKIDLPEALIPDIEAEAIRRHISPDAIIREALHLWHANRQPPMNDRDRLMQVL